MAGLTLENWIRFFVWLVIGLVIYFIYSRKRSTLGAEPGRGAPMKFCPNAALPAHETMTPPPSVIQRLISAPVTADQR